MKCEENTGMKINTMLRHLREGIKNITRNAWMSFASISSIAISLFILGIFLLLTLNVSYIADQIEKQVEIRVYLEMGTSPEEIREVEDLITGIPQVKTLTFISKEQGLIYLGEKLGESGKELLGSFKDDENPLNDAFTIEVKDPQFVAETAELIETINMGRLSAPIVKVSYGKGTIETLFKVTNVIRTIGFGIVTLLSITAVFLIANTIKLTIMARRKEISIMKLVGATNTFIRWPFFIEGAMIGFIGSFIPILILLYIYWNLINTGKLDLSLLFLKLKPYDEVNTILIVLLLGIGAAIGIFGSLLSIRKYLKV